MQQRATDGNTEQRDRLDLEQAVRRLAREHPELFAEADRLLRDGDPDPVMTMPVGYGDAALRRRELAQRLRDRHGDAAWARYWREGVSRAQLLGPPGRSQAERWNLYARRDADPGDTEVASHHPPTRAWLRRKAASLYPHPRREDDPEAKSRDRKARARVKKRLEDGCKAADEWRFEVWKDHVPPRRMRSKGVLRHVARPMLHGHGYGPYDGGRLDEAFDTALQVLEAHADDTGAPRGVKAWREAWAKRVLILVLLAVSEDRPPWAEGEFWAIPWRTTGEGVGIRMWTDGESQGGAFVQPGERFVRPNADRYASRLALCELLGRQWPRWRTAIAWALQVARDDMGLEARTALDGGREGVLTDGGGTPKEDVSGHDLPLTTTTHGRLSIPDLARSHDLTEKQTEALRSRLKTWRKKHMNNQWVRVPHPRPREPRYLYDPQAVQPLIEDIKAKARISGEPPAKRPASA